eukprot:2120105-Rhodomonas_salina.3
MQQPRATFYRRGGQNLGETLPRAAGVNARPRSHRQASTLRLNVTLLSRPSPEPFERSRWV